MKIISSSAIPVLTGAILILALMRGKNAYDLFMSGAEYGLKTSINIAVPLVGLLAAVSMLRASGAMELKIGSASCWERVYISVVAVSLKNKNAYHH